MNFWWFFKRSEGIILQLKLIFRVFFLFHFFLAEKAKLIEIFGEFMGNLIDSTGVIIRTKEKIFFKLDYSLKFLLGLLFVFQNS